MKTMILAAVLLAVPAVARADCGHRDDTRCTLEPGKPAQHTLWLRAQERDWWRVTLPAHQRYEAFVNDGANGCSFMFVRDRSGLVQAAVLYEHSDFNTSIRFTTPKAGTYYIEVVEAFCSPPPAGYSIELNAR